MSEDSEKQQIALSDADEWGGITGLRPLIATEDGLVTTIPIERLQFRNPLETSPWIDGPDVQLPRILKALKDQDFERESYPGFSYSSTSDWDTKRHERRIAFLIANPDPNPISVEFTSPNDPTLSLEDGWHRYAAALVRGDTEININVGGFFSFSVQRLGAFCEEYQVITPTFNHVFR